MEEYYPSPYTKNTAQAQELQTNGKKVEYAQEVASNITREQFEQNMPIIFQALEASNSLSFNPK